MKNSKGYPKTNGGIPRGVVRDELGAREQGAGREGRRVLPRGLAAVVQGCEEGMLRGDLPEEELL